MFMQSLYIKQFKNIRELSIDKLGTVNLIVGKNNVGKSTILEAVAIYLSNGSEPTLKSLLKNRGETIAMLSSAEDDSDYESIVKGHYISLFMGREENYESNYSIIIGDGQNEKDRVVINQVYVGERSEKRADGLNVLAREVIPENVINQRQSDFLTIRKGLMIQSVEGKSLILYANKFPSYTYKYKCNFQYVHTSDFNNDDNAALFDKIALSPEEDYIIQALNIIDPAINKLNFINNESLKSERIPVVSTKGSDKRYRLSSMGDGINRILTIILALLNCKDGVLLLDEFETGLHYSVQEKLWDIIFMLSEKLKIQVFVTTHSNDCINSFVKSKINATVNGQVIRLEKQQDDICAKVFDDNDDLKFLTDNSIEIR